VIGLFDWLAGHGAKREKKEEKNEEERKPPSAGLLWDGFRPFGPTYFWTGAPKSKQKALFKRL
jgi:hypothetical protein